MKKMRKIFAVLLTLAMVLGMSMTSFAADAKAKITLKNFDKANKVEYMQIIQKDETKLLVGHLLMVQEHALQQHSDLKIQMMHSSRLSGD